MHCRNRGLVDLRHKGDAGNGQKREMARRYYANGSEAEKGWRRCGRVPVYWPGKKGRGVVLWDAETGAELAVLEGHVIGVNSASFSPDGQRVVTTSNDRTARSWDAETGAEQVVLTGHIGWVNAAIFSSDGHRVVTASSDGTARLWDAETGAELDVFEGHTEHVFSASFSPDGQRVITASFDRTVRIWRVLPYASLKAMMAEAARRLSRGFSEAECQFYFREDMVACPREAP